MKEFTDLLERGLVTTYHQLIVDRQGQLVAYELLGRGRPADLPEDPAVPFTLVHHLNQEVQLSELFCRRAIVEAETVNLQGLPLIHTILKGARILGIY